MRAESRGRLLVSVLKVMCFCVTCISASDGGGGDTGRRETICIKTCEPNG